MSLFRRSFACLSHFLNVELKFWNNCAENGQSKKKYIDRISSLKMYVKKPLTMAHFKYTPPIANGNNGNVTVKFTLKTTAFIRKLLYIANERIDVWPYVYSLWLRLVWFSFVSWPKYVKRKRETTLDLFSIYSIVIIRCNFTFSKAEYTRERYSDCEEEMRFKMYLIDNRRNSHVLAETMIS